MKESNVVIIESGMNADGRKEGAILDRTDIKVSILRTVSPSQIESVTSRFGEDTEFNGVYRSKSQGVGLEISGKVSAKFELGEDSCIFLNESGEAVESLFVADVVVLAGKFVGEVKASVVEVLPKAQISGSISCKTLDVHAGAVLKATVHMS